MKKILLSILVIFGFSVPSFSEEIIEEEVVVTEETADQMSADALNNYEVSGSLFERITALEQEKVVMQLEKERAQLDLELERLNAEKIKIQMELDTLSGRAEQQQQELEATKAQLEAQTEKLKRQLEQPDEEEVVPEKQPKKVAEGGLSKNYKLVNVIGVGNQLQATIEEISSGQNKRVSVGKQIDGYVVKSISLNDGIVFEKDGEEENINIGK
jgi:septal ring factor EnvC (AmiA/AmiB activator)